MEIYPNTKNDIQFQLFLDRNKTILKFNLDESHFDKCQIKQALAHANVESNIKWFTTKTNDAKSSTLPKLTENK